MWWFLLALISGFSAAVLAIVIKVYLKHLNPLFICFLFSAIGTVLILLIDLFTKKIHCTHIAALSWKEWLPLISVGCLNILAFSCYILALKYGKPAGVVAIDRLGVLYVVIFSIFFLHESFSIRTIMGALTMIFGAVLLSW